MIMSFLALRSNMVSVALRIESRLLDQQHSRPLVMLPWASSFAYSSSLNSLSLYFSNRKVPWASSLLTPGCLELVTNLEYSSAQSYFVKWMNEWLDAHIDSCSVISEIVELECDYFIPSFKKYFSHFSKLSEILYDYSKNHLWIAYNISENAYGIMLIDKSRMQSFTVWQQLHLEPYLCVCVWVGKEVGKGKFLVGCYVTCFICFFPLHFPSFL